MSLGKTIRINRLFAHQSKRLCSIAIDHFIAYQESLPGGLRDLPAVLEQIMAGGPDAVTMHPGVARSCWAPYAGQIPLIIQSLIGRLDDSADEIWAVPEDAVRLGADAFATVAFIRGPTEGSHLRRVADLVRQADAVEMPVILHIYPRIFPNDSKGSVTVSTAPEDIAWAVRCAIESGVDVIKTPFTGDRASFRDILSSCPVPVVVAGGPQTSTIEESLEQMREAMRAGARGATIGRNVWSAEDVCSAVQRFKAIIHDQPED
ncbi:MAG: aldolase [Planctomycetaceae bacterium]|nr:aldolase [Planctomycetaceae bacterium]